MEATSKAGGAVGSVCENATVMPSAVNPRTKSQLGAWVLCIARTVAIQNECVKDRPRLTRSLTEGQFPSLPRRTMIEAFGSGNRVSGPFAVIVDLDGGPSGSAWP